MPLPELDFGEAEGPPVKDRLLTFVRSVRRVIELSLTDADFETAIDAGMGRLLRDAVAEIAPHLDQLEVAVTELSPDAMVAHGLGGKQLSAKTGLVRRLWDKLRSAFAPKLAKRLLDAIDNLLDSILEATGVGSAIKEVKGAIANSIEA